MGKSFLDIWSFGHFLSGFITFLLLKSIQINLFTNFFIANGLHFILEILEKNQTPNGIILETFDNHFGDIITFLLGWFIASKINFNSFTNLHNNIFILLFFWILIMIVYIYEIYKEIKPYNNGIIKGVYVKYLYS